MGSFRRTLVAIGASAAIAVTGGLWAPAAQAAALPFNQAGQLPILAAEYGSQSDCPDQPNGTDGWHFVAPSGSFSSLSAGFDTTGDGLADVTVTIPPDGPNGFFTKDDNSQAYIYAQAGAPLVSASANGSGTDKFVLSHTCPGAKLDVSKTANTTYTRTYQWDIDKSVDPATWNLFEGDSGTSTWTVEVDKTGYVDSAWAVSGDIKIENMTLLDATVESVTDMISGGISPSVDCGVTFPYTLVAGGQLDCTYSSLLPDGATRLNTATVTTSGWVGGGTATADVKFSDTPSSIVNGSINVTDTNGKSWGPVSDDDSWSYDETFTCDEDEGTHKNIATITETKQYAEASVLVNCYTLRVTKDAATSLDRDWDWTIEKKEKDNIRELRLSTDQTYDVTYKVDVKATPVDSNWKVTQGASGIQVSNPAPIDAVIKSVTDVVSVGINATVDCGVTFPYTLQAGKTLTCSYSADLPDGSDRVNTATATLQNYSYGDGDPTEDGTTDFTGTADVLFANAVINESDKCVTVSDPLMGDPVELCAGDKTMWTLEYTATVGPYEECGEYEFPNKASLATDDGKTLYAEWNILVDVPCDTGCTLTIGYWKTHSPYFRDGAKNDPAWDLLDDGTHDTKAIYEILTTPPKGDAYYILAHQYIGATLNILSGASMSGEALEAYNKATDLIHNNGPGVSKADKKKWTSLASVLDRYNNGYIGPGHCDEQV